MGFISLYYMVDSKNIKKNIFGNGELALCNSSMGTFSCLFHPKIGEEGIEESFDHYNIPNDFRKLVIKVGLYNAINLSHNLGWSYVKGKELTTNRQFELNSFDEKSGRNVVGITYPHGDIDDRFGEMGRYEPLIVFETQTKPVSYYSIMSFLHKMKEQELLESYRKAIFDVLSVENFHKHYKNNK